jgi:hypothetical protein
MSTENPQQLRLCKGPLHKNDGAGTMIPHDSFASDRSHWCRRCQSDYDQKRGSLRGASRASRKEVNNNNNHQQKESMKMSVSRNSTQELPLTGKGVERVVIKAVDQRVSKYVRARDARMELTTKEVEAKTELIKAMRDNKEKISTDAEGTMIYRHDDLLVTLKHGKDELKVRTEESEEPNGE